RGRVGLRLTLDVAGRRVLLTHRGQRPSSTRSTRLLRLPVWLPRMWWRGGRRRRLARRARSVSPRFVRRTLALGVRWRRFPGLEARHDLAFEPALEQLLDVGE